MGSDIVGPVTEPDDREFGCVIAAIASRSKLNVLKIDCIRRIVFRGSMVAIILVYPIAFPLYRYCNSTFFRLLSLPLSTQMMMPPLLIMIAHLDSNLGSVAAEAVGVERLVAAGADRTSS